MHELPVAVRRPVRSLAGRLVPGRRLRGELALVRRERDQARRRAERLQARLDGRVRDDLGYLFVLTYGRSGSTLLQGIVNSIPGYLIRGENQQLLRHLHAYHREGLAQRRRLRRSRRRRGLPAVSEPVDSWYGMEGFPPRSALVGARRLALDTLLRPGPDTRVVGFKEIRWRGPDLDDYVAWLAEVFPGARFVVNTRDLDDVARSRWWADQPDARRHLEKVEGRLLSLAESLGDAAFHVRYDDYVQDLAALRPFFDWLGEEHDEARLRAVVDVPHSY